ncbi:MAG: hypothetical protein ACK5LC_05350 [Coprobacillaceae bacterium]
MGKNKIYHYYVEGETEKKLINILKTEYQIIKSGKVEKFNITIKKMKPNRVIPLKKGTIVVLVFDTDIENSSILDANIEFLEKQKNISEIICITQVNNLEDELKRSCKITEIKHLTGSMTNTEFKKDMLKQSNLKKKLDDKCFDFSRFWIMSPKESFSHIENEAKKIKL